MISSVHESQLLNSSPIVLQFTYISNLPMSGIPNDQGGVCFDLSFGAVHSMVVCDVSSNAWRGVSKRTELHS